MNQIIFCIYIFQTLQLSWNFVYQIGLIRIRLDSITSLFNVSGYVRCRGRESLHRWIAREDLRLWRLCSILRRGCHEQDLKCFHVFLYKPNFTLIICLVSNKTITTIRSDINFLMTLVTHAGKQSDNPASHTARSSPFIFQLVWKLGAEI